MAKSSVVRASAKQGGQRGRLVLEQSTWASHYRVEKVARNELEMAAPDMTMYKVVPQ